VIVQSDIYQLGARVRYVVTRLLYRLLWRQKQKKLKTVKDKVDCRVALAVTSSIALGYCMCSEQLQQQMPQTRRIIRSLELSCATHVDKGRPLASLAGTLNGHCRSLKS